MKGKILLPVLFFFLFFHIAFAQDAEFHPRQLIIKLRSEVAFAIEEGGAKTGLPAIDALNKELGAISIEPFIRSRPRAARRERPNTSRILLLRFGREIQAPAAAARYQATGLVEYAEPNYAGYGGGVEGITPDDDFYFRQWGLKNDGTFDAQSVAGADINMEPAWEFTQGDPDNIIAILDSGARLGHPEFAGRLWENAADIPGNGLDDDQNGYVDDSQAWDFVNNDNEPADDHGHGSNVSGIMAATGNNGIGYAGVDWESQVMICKILNDQNSGFYTWWTEAIYYAVDHGASVINMSVGGSGYSSSMEEAVNYAHANNVAVVACMMNTNQGVPFYPAAYDATIAVGATGTNDRRVEPFFWSNTSGSNYGPHIDLVAPGNYIYGLDDASDLNFNSYWGGTSQASPLVAGVVSLMKALSPGLDVESIRNILRNTADDEVGNPEEDIPGWDQYYGAGRLNAFRALESLYSMVGVENSSASWAALNIYPNPAGAGQAIMLEAHLGQPQEARLTVRNGLGQQLYSARVWLDGNTLIALPESLPAGKHQVILTGSAGQQSSQSFLVVR